MSAGAQKVKQILKSGGTAVGTFFHWITDPAIADMVPDGLDFAVCNTEHNAYDVGDFLGISRTLSDKGIAVLARVHNQDPWNVAKACDAFDGAVIPYVEDLGQVKQLAAAAVYRPLKGVSLQNMSEKGEWPSKETQAYIEEKCADTLFVPMIESVKGIENLDAICSVPGIDTLLVGPNDLSVSLGIPNEYDNEKFWDAVKTIIDTAEKHGIAAGAHFSRIDLSERLIKAGGRFIPFSNDGRFFQNGMTSMLERLKGSTGTTDDHVI
jgi:2-keto-3-deoxy-L-rhamnonate aldolase RhmA